MLCGSAGIREPRLDTVRCDHGIRWDRRLAPDTGHRGDTLSCQGRPLRYRTGPSGKRKYAKLGKVLQKNVTCNELRDVQLLSSADLAHLAAIPTGQTEKDMAKQANVDATPVVRTSAGLRDAIFDELDAIRTGNSNPTRANAVAKLAGSIVETVRMEVEVQKHIRQTATNKVPVSESAGLGMPMALGSNA